MAEDALRVIALSTFKQAGIYEVYLISTTLSQAMASKLAVSIVSKLAVSIVSKLVVSIISKLAVSIVT